MEIFDTVDAVRTAVLRDRWRDSSDCESSPIRNAKRTHASSVGLVPTMGALHAGHLSLVQRSVDRCDRTYVTIFLNPTQFAIGEDLDAYPKPLDADLQMLRDAGVDGVFTPPISVMYPPGEIGPCHITPPAVADALEGQSRPTHFAGVCTVVAKLFHILPATDAFFGKKDYQQWRVIETMVRQLNFDIRVHGCPLVRDDDGVALSSRNAYLSDEERVRARSLSRSLAQVQQAVSDGDDDVDRLTESLRRGLSGLDAVHYAVIRNRHTLRPTDTVDRSVALVAATVGDTRLIDNVELGSDVGT